MKGSPLARRILVKYTVPEPMVDESTPKWSQSMRHTFVTLYSEREVYIPLWHTYLYPPKYEEINQTRHRRNVNIPRRLPMGPR